MLARSLSIQAEVASRSRKSPRLEGSVTCLLFSGDCASSSVGMLEDGLVSSLVGGSNDCLILLFPLCGSDERRVGLVTRATGSAQIAAVSGMMISVATHSACTSTVSSERMST